MVPEIFRLQEDHPGVGSKRNLKTCGFHFVVCVSLFLMRDLVFFMSIPVRE